MIDYEALREALRDECFAAHFGGGIGPALMDALDVDDMSPEELVEAARTWGVDVWMWMILTSSLFWMLLTFISRLSSSEQLNSNPLNPA